MALRSMMWSAKMFFSDPDTRPRRRFEIDVDSVGCVTGAPEAIEFLKNEGLIELRAVGPEDVELFLCPALHNQHCRVIDELGRGWQPTPDPEGD